MKTCVVYCNLTFLTVNLINQLGDHFDCIHVIASSKSELPPLEELHKLKHKTMLHSLKHHALESIVEVILQESASLDVLLCLHHALNPDRQSHSFDQLQWKMGFSAINRIMHLFTPRFKQQGRGIILNVDAMEGWLEEDGFSAMSASHHAVMTMTTETAAALGHHGVDVALLERGFLKGTHLPVSSDRVRDRPEDPRLIVNQILRLILQKPKQVHNYCHSVRQHRRESTYASR